jgi:hypothetical protein
MATYPVQLRVEPPQPMARIQLLIRFVLLTALGSLGWSSLYWLLYLGLPAIVALRISQKGGERYLAEDAPRLAPALRWLAQAYAYLSLLTDAVPNAERGQPVELEVEPAGAPSVGSALLRIVYSVPALLLLIVLSVVAGFCWLAQALVILVRRRPSLVLRDFLALTLGYQLRLIGYHLSLVDRYPSLAGAEGAPAPIAPTGLTHGTQPSP